MTDHSFRGDECQTCEVWGIANRLLASILWVDMNQVVVFFFSSRVAKYLVSVFPPFQFSSSIRCSKHTFILSCHFMSPFQVKKKKKSQQVPKFSFWRDHLKTNINALPWMRLWNLGFHCCCTPGTVLVADGWRSPILYYSCSHTVPKAITCGDKICLAYSLKSNSYLCNHILKTGSILSLH